MKCWPISWPGAVWIGAKKATTGLTSPIGPSVLRSRKNRPEKSLRFTLAIYALCHFEVHTSDVGRDNSGLGHRSNLEERRLL